MANAAADQPNEATSPTATGSDRPEIAQQIEDVMRQGSRQIQFDTIEKRFRGKRVWVLDREKMQAGVMRVVDQAIYKSQQEAEGNLKTRQRVAAAITNLFNNRRNLTSPIDPSATASQPAAQPRPANNALEDQIARLAILVNRAERVLAMGGSTGGVGSTHRRFASPLGSAPIQPTQEKVLMKILEDNLKLIEDMKVPTPTQQGD